MFKIVRFEFSILTILGVCRAPRVSSIPKHKIEFISMVQSFQAFVDFAQVPNLDGVHPDA